MTSFIEQAISEMKSHPITLLLVIAGWLAIGFGYTNFARASEVKLVEGKVDRVLELQLTTTLRELQSEYCNAHSAESRALLANTIEDYERMYRDLTGDRYPLPKCNPKT